jgi:hypothetical protein
MTDRPEKSLDRKLARLRDDPACDEFILADAKDADMAFGIAAPGQSPEYHGHEGRFRSLAEYRQLMRDNVRQGLVDIMLMSASSNELLTIEERLFDPSHVTPAVRANDTTDIHLARGARYRDEPARPFRSAVIDHALCGRRGCEPGDPPIGADLGLFSVTFNNDLDADLAMLEAYKQFRLEAEAKGFRHFLEVFEPNACGERCPEDLGRFIVDNIVRLLAGVPKAGRPLFLKMPYLGPKPMEMLVHYDPTLIPGIMGGSSGTTFDAFDQLLQAKKYGARAALYGRMINNAEHQPTFIAHLRRLADGELTDPAEAVRSYHGALRKLGIKPYRPLDDDLQATRRYTSYSGSQAVVDGGRQKTDPSDTPIETVSAPAARIKRANTIGVHGRPDFANMSPAEKIAWNRARWDRVLG